MTVSRDFDKEFLTLNRSRTSRLKTFNKLTTTNKELYMFSTLNIRTLEVVNSIDSTIQAPPLFKPEFPGKKRSKKGCLNCRKRKYVWNISLNKEVLLTKA